MRRFSLWLRGRPIVADSLLAAFLMVLDALGVGNEHHKASYLVFSLLLPVPLILRRIYPRAMAAAMFLLSVLCTLVGYLVGDDTSGHVALIGLGVMLYTLVAYVGRRDGLIYLVCLAVDLGLSLLILSEPVGGDIALVFAIYALCWTLAEFNGARHAYDAEVAARLAVADYDKERRAHEAVAAERTRIARELHDVVAHAVSVIIVQADGAKYALRHDPDTAERALATIAGTGRDALRELRRTVALLRTEHAPELLPQHGSAGIARLAEMMRDAGLAVELELTGELDDITPEVSLGVHRIVQESLTNTLRHAGSSPKATVRVHRRADDILIEVTDSGGVPVEEPDIPGTGMGLVGMRERVAVLGGTLSAGRTGDGRWRVSATLPLRAETD
ncbi:sensor histidine kinase [Nocardia rhizosphaerihabitans]|uniref:histidine kinase n=1 Tax=Nocardia rhizosphaerihabitans TaxID=1691570 RepID=A0ABQ2K5K4_9NOCA|nr:histidine kinase [Nocardia rhizosphaerihabitans]GGN66720.1 two-component sensor histidine kinase [Nocardia rhizosphaerihabitans]